MLNTTHHLFAFNLFCVLGVFLSHFVSFVTQHGSFEVLENIFRIAGSSFEMGPSPLLGVVLGAVGDRTSEQPPFLHTYVFIGGY